MAFMVPYRSSGGARTMVERSLTSVGTRAHGRMSFAPPPMMALQPVTRAPGALAGLACCSECSGGAEVSYQAAKRMELGALGASPLWGTAAGAIASKGAAMGASALVTMMGAGAVAGPIGMAVGLVVGILSQKLFGHADYAKVAGDVATRLKYAEAYKQVAGQYPGRLYGPDELKQIWYGLVHEGIFPKNAGGGWAPGASCNIQACINGQRDSKGNCPGCGGSEGWANDLFTGSLVNKVQGFTGAIQQATQQGMQNPVQIADQVLIPAWSGPDEGRKNIKWASPGNSTSPALVRQLMIDTLDAVEYESNKSLPVFYGTVPGQAAPAAVAPPPPVASAPAPVWVSPCTAPQLWNGTQCVLPNTAPLPAQSAQPACAPPYVWNGTQCVLPVNAVPPSAAPPAGAVPPSGFSPVGNDASGNPIFANPQGVLYSLTGTGMQIFSGQLASGSSAAAQMQAALQNALAQGQSAQQAAAAALQQAQSAGVQVTPAVQQQVAAQVDATQTAPVQTAPHAAGFGAGLGNTAALLSIGATVLGLMFATARPKGSPARRPRRSRRRG